MQGPLGRRRYARTLYRSSVLLYLCLGPSIWALTAIPTRPPFPQRLNNAYKNTLNGAKVTLIEGRGKVVDAHTVEVGGVALTWVNRTCVLASAYGPGRGKVVDAHTVEVAGWVGGGGVRGHGKRGKGPPSKCRAVALPRNVMHVQASGEYPTVRQAARLGRASCLRLTHLCRLTHHLHCRRTTWCNYHALALRAHSCCKRIGAKHMPCATIYPIPCYQYAAWPVEHVCFTT